MKAVEALDQPGPDGAVVAGAGGDTDHLKAAAVVALDQRRQLERHGMLAKIRRDIGQPYPVMAVFFAAPQRRQRPRHQRAGRSHGALQLQLLVVAIAQKGEGCSHYGDGFRAISADACPVAQVQHRHGAIGPGGRVFGIQLQRPVVAFHRLTIAFQPHQDRAAIVKYRGGTGLQRQGGIERGKGFFETLLLRQDHAAIIVRLKIAGLRRQNAVIGDQCFVKAPRCHQGMGVVHPRGNVSGIALYRLVQQGDGFVITSLLRLEETQHVQGREIAGIGAQDLPVRASRQSACAALSARWAVTPCSKTEPEDT